MALGRRFIHSRRIRKAPLGVRIQPHLVWKGFVGAFTWRPPELLREVGDVGDKTRRDREFPPGWVLCMQEYKVPFSALIRDDEMKCIAIRTSTHPSTSDPPAQRHPVDGDRAASFPGECHSTNLPCLGRRSNPRAPRGLAVRCGLRPAPCADPRLRRDCEDPRPWSRRDALRIPCRPTPRLGPRGRGSW